MTSKEITKEKVIEFLRDVSIMTLAAINDGKPLSTVLLFAVDDDLNFYFATRTETYKAKALLKNPKVSLSAWEHRKMLVQVDGKAKEITREEEINEALELLAKSTANIKDFWPPILRVKGKGEYIIFKITPSWARSMNLDDNSIKEKETSFTEIEIN